MAETATVEPTMRTTPRVFRWRAGMTGSHTTPTGHQQDTTAKGPLTAFAHEAACTFTRRAARTSVISSKGGGGVRLPAVYGTADVSFIAAAFGSRYDLAETMDEQS